MFEKKNTPRKQDMQTSEPLTKSHIKISKY